MSRFVSKMYSYSDTLYRNETERMSLVKVVLVAHTDDATIHQRKLNPDVACLESPIDGLQE